MFTRKKRTPAYGTASRRDDMRKLRDKLNAMAHLKDGWIDGEAGSAVSITALERAENVLSEMEKLNNISELVVPTEEGGVQFFWGGTPSQLSIEVDPSGSIYIHDADLQTGIYRDEEIPNGSPLAESLRKWLT